MRLAALLIALAIFQAPSIAQEQCKLTVAQAREKFPDLSSLDDAAFVGVIHSVYYPTVPVAQFHKMICYTPPPPAPAKPNLNAFERWRYEACQKDAAKAPTSQGVSIGMRLCREKFDQ